MEQHVFGVARGEPAGQAAPGQGPMLHRASLSGVSFPIIRCIPPAITILLLKDADGAPPVRHVPGTGVPPPVPAGERHAGHRPGPDHRVSRDGAYQLCDALIPEGAGDLAVAFQQLKDKLHAEGPFDPCP